MCLKDFLIKTSLENTTILLITGPVTSTLPFLMYRVFYFFLFDWPATPDIVYITCCVARKDVFWISKTELSIN